jgi:hypothetical protein
MILNEIIEEEDEEKSNQKKDNNNCHNSKKINNIQVIKDENNEYFNDKEKKINKINHKHKSISASKDNKNYKMQIPSYEKLNFIMNEKELNKDKDTLDIKNENNTKLHLPSLSKNINFSLEKNKFMRNDSPSTSAFTNSNKKNLINGHNFTDEISQYRMGLLSANSSSNNNSIIPMLPIKRPISNFNFGGNPLWEINNQNNINQNDLNNNNKINSNNHNNEIKIGKSNINKAPIVINELSQRNEANNFSKTSNKKENIFKSLEFKKFLSSSKYNNNLDNLENHINNNNNNVIVPKLNQIKIEKGLMNNRLANIFNKQLSDSKKNSSKNNIFQVKNGNKSRSVKKKI